MTPHQRNGGSRCQNSPIPNSSFCPRLRGAMIAESTCRQTSAEAVRKAVDKLIRTGLLEEVRANGSLLAWRRDAEARPMPLPITNQALQPIALNDIAVETPAETSARPAPDQTKIEAPAVEVVASRKRASVARQTSVRTRHHTGKAKTKAGSSRESRPGSKQAHVLALLNRREGAT